MLRVRLLADADGAAFFRDVKEAPSLWAVPDADMWRYRACYAAAVEAEREINAQRAAPKSTPRDLIDDVETNG